jgi:hypothetical protein
MGWILSLDVMTGDNAHMDIAADLHGEGHRHGARRNVVHDAGLVGERDGRLSRCAADPPRSSRQAA